MNIQENIGDQYKLLIYNYLSNRASDNEKKTLLEWLEESDENKKLFAEFRRIFELSASISHKGKFSKGKSNAWKNLNKKISSIENAKEKKIRKIGYYIRVAASVILIFSAGALSSLWLSKDYSNRKLSNIEHEIIVPRGGKSVLVLPDGTKVWLNAGSRFRYKGDYGFGNRNVSLEGEGYFSVIKNPKKPFVVETSGLKIKAFGTSFNVKAYPEEKMVTTTLVEGVVKIEGKGVNVSLKPKQVVMLKKEGPKSHDLLKEKSKLPKSKNISQSLPAKEENANLNDRIQLESDVNTSIYTSWKDNLWIIDSESLKNIAVVLERKFNVNIHIESQELNQYKFTGTFNKETLEQILNVIRLTAPLKYEINKGEVVIREETRRKATYNDFVK